MKLPASRDFFDAELTQNRSALNAWDHFGNLDLDQAYFKFIADPMTYQEDFAFMGAGAFKFYFPVLDRYLRVYRCGVGPGDPDDSFATNIASALCCQLLRRHVRFDVQLQNQFRELTGYVRTHLENLAADTLDQTHIDSYWQIFSAQLDQLHERGA